MISTFHLTNESFGVSKAIHSPVDLNIKQQLANRYGSYIESTNENKGQSSGKRRDRWIVCANHIRTFLEPIVDLNEFKYAYPTNGIHESIDHMCAKTDYQILKGEYRYSTFVKKPVHVANTVEDLKPSIPLYMSNPFSATGCFDSRYDYIGRNTDIPIYLDLAFIGTTQLIKIYLYPTVKEVFWSCSKAYGLGLLRAGIRFSRKEEILQRELQGVGYFNHAIIDVFKAVTLSSSVTNRKGEYAEQQQAVCKQFDLTPSDSFLLGTTTNSAWDRFKRETGINRVCLSAAYESIAKEEKIGTPWAVF